jgi:hypothetical protein
MISLFYVPNDMVELTKKFIRKYPSARFLQEPFDLFGRKTEFKIEIDVKEYNQLSKDLTSNYCYCLNEQSEYLKTDLFSRIILWTKNLFK